MSNIPSLKPREILEILFRAGFKKVRSSGSHIRLVKGRKQVTIPFHSKGTIPTGTFRSILRQSGLTMNEFLTLRKE